MENTNFKNGFEKTAFVGTLARGAGKITGIATRAGKATAAGGNKLVNKAKQHIGGIKEHVSRNFKAGVEGKAGSTYGQSLGISKAKATRSAAAGDKAYKAELKTIKAGEPVKAQATPKGAKPAKSANPPKEVKQPKSKFNLTPEAKKNLAVGAVAAGGGMYLGSQNEPQNVGYVQ